MNKRIIIKNVEIEEIAHHPNMRVSFILRLPVFPGSQHLIKNVNKLEGDGSKAKITKADIIINISEDETHTKHLKKVGLSSFLKEVGKQHKNKPILKDESTCWVRIHNQTHL